MGELGILSIDKLRLAMSILAKPGRHASPALCTLRAEPTGRVVAIGAGGSVIVTCEETIEPFEGAARHWIPGGSLTKAAKTGYIELGHGEATLYPDKGSEVILEAVQGSAYPDYQTKLTDAERSEAEPVRKWALDMQWLAALMGSLSSWPKASRATVSTIAGNRAFIDIDTPGVTILTGRVFLPEEIEPTHTEGVKP